MKSSFSSKNNSLCNPKLTSIDINWLLSILNTINQSKLIQHSPTLTHTNQIMITIILW